MMVRMVSALLMFTAMLCMAEAQTYICSYYRSEPVINLMNAPCEVSTEKVVVGSISISLREISRQGQWAKMTLNGKPATRFEYDRVTFFMASDDLNEFLDYKLAAAPTPQVVRTNFWIGRWYSDHVRVCRGRPGETEGLLTFTAKEFIGLENSCRITRVVPKGSAAELTLRCSGEGMTSTDREVVEVVDGKLRRTVVVDGKPETFSYSRCP
jgi:hypothetical protein